MADHVEDLAPTNPTHQGVNPGVWVAVAIGAVVLAVVFVAAGHSSNGSGGSTGSAQSGVTAYGQPLNLTLKSFTDPATDGSGNTSDSQDNNDHYAVVNVDAINDGNSTLPSSIPVTITAFGSDGQAYDGTSETPTGDTLCNIGSNEALAPSETLTYCKGYVLPENVTVTRIEVSGNQGAGSGTVSWNVSDGFTGWSN